MPRTVHIIGSRSSGGAERFFARLVTALEADGTPCIAVTPPDSALLDELGADVPTVAMAMRGIWDLSARWRISRLAKRWRPAIVQTWMGRATRLTHIRAERGIVHVARLGGYYNLKGYRHAHAWVANTRGIRDYLLREGLPAERVFHIGNFIDEPPRVEDGELAALRDRLGIDPDAWVIVSAGRLHPNKGFEDLLGAAARIPEQVGQRPVVFLILGDGPLRNALREAARSLGIGARLRFTGWQGEPAAHYMLADLFVCPSRHEPLGNVVLEAWCYGVPIVATRSDGPSELIADGENGVLVPCRDPRALASACVRLLSESDEARAQMAAAGRLTLAREHGREAVVAAYQALYQRLSGDAETA